MSEIKGVIYRPGIHILQDRTALCPDQKKLSEQVDGG